MSNNHRAQKPGALVVVAVSPDSLPPLIQMLRRVPADCRLAFILVPSTTESLDLSVPSPFPVELAIDGKPLEANHVYRLPSGALAECQDGCLRLSFGPLAPQRRLQRLLISLAGNYGPASFGVALTRLEGEELAEGLLAIRGAGGVTFGEDPAYRDRVDFVLPAEAIGHELASLMSSLPYLDENGMQPDDFLLKIFTLLRQRTGVDFAQYKPSTVGRRIKRRMLLQRFENLEQYYHSLRQSPEAVDCLYQDMLITVTGLFRDPDAYEVLARRVFPSILDRLQPDQSVRIWIPGCSKGDEVYSIAITLLEVMAERNEHYGVQIFATDINEKALERARAGLYPESLVEELSEERVQRYFQKVERGYQISKSVRDMCVFARQDLTCDPPFSRLDLISCRNLLIYLNTALQYKILGIFHYALKPGGYLLLGASESIGRAREFFAQVDRLMRIFSRRTTVLPVPLEPFEAVSAQMPARSAEHPTPLRSLPVTTSNGSEVYKEADRLVLGRFAPPGVLINDDLEVLQFRGRTGLFLEHPPG